MCPQRSTTFSSDEEGVQNPRYVVFDKGQSRKNFTQFIEYEQRRFSSTRELLRRYLAELLNNRTNHRLSKDRYDNLACLLIDMDSIQLVPQRGNEFNTECLKQLIRMKALSGDAFNSMKAVRDDVPIGSTFFFEAWVKSFNKTIEDDDALQDALNRLSI